MKVPTNKRILDYLAFHEGYVSGAELEDNARKWETKASTISRRCRELADSGAIEREIKGRFVQYRLKRPEPTIDPLEIEELQGALL